MKALATTVYVHYLGPGAQSKYLIACFLQELYILSLALQINSSCLSAAMRFYLPVEKLCAIHVADTKQ